MALYVNTENQTLLWNVVHTQSFAIQFFSTLSPSQKTEWFKSIIKRFYEPNANRNLSLEELQRLNKATLSYMLSSMKSNEVQNTVQQDPPKNSKEMVFSQQFDMKKKEYDSLLERKAPESIDFREKIEDGAISNMGDLIQTHIREREEELRKYSLQTNLIPQPSNIQSLKIDPSTTVSSEILNAQVLDNEEKRQKKNVTWKIDDAEHTFMFFEDFEAFKQQTREQLRLLHDQIYELQKNTTVVL
jgi:hypothetical protein